jgi:hypothetical protein
MRKNKPFRDYYVNQMQNLINVASSGKVLNLAYSQLKNADNLVIDRLTRQKIECIKSTIVLLINDITEFAETEGYRIEIEKKRHNSRIIRRRKKEQDKEKEDVKLHM